MSVDAVVVDSDPATLRTLCELLSEYSKVLTITGTALSGTEAIEVLNRRRPAVVFFDVLLGDMDAFEVLRTVSYNPLLVFTTGGESYAVKAFELGAVDYLLKPIDPERLSVTLDRIAARTASTQGDAMLCKRSNQSNNGPLTSLSSRIGKNKYLLSVSDIDVFEAQGYYAAAWVGDRRYPVRISLAELESRLADCGFIRIHRKYVVNTDHVSSMGTSKPGTGHLQLASHQDCKLPISRRKVAALRKLFALDDNFGPGPKRQ